MHHRTYLTAALAAALLAVPASAANASGAAPTIERAQEIAYAVFPGHCGPVLPITWDPTLFDRNRGAEALLNDETCSSTRLDPRLITLDPAGLCDRLVHERGHIIGLDHTTHGIMSAYGIHPVAACHAHEQTQARPKRRTRQQIARSMRYKRQLAKIRARRLARA